jgi:hypothetical protein
MVDGDDHGSRLDYQSHGETGGEEGKSVQILHIGPFDKETPMLRRMHNEFTPAKNLTFNGKHHEIYTSDPRKVAPEKLRTIVRQPVKKMIKSH